MSNIERSNGTSETSGLSIEHQHRWIIEDPRSSLSKTSPAHCVCGKRRRFLNSLDTRKPFRDPNNQQYNKRPFMAKLASLSLDAIHTDRIDLVEGRVIGQKI